MNTNTCTFSNFFKLGFIWGGGVVKTTPRPLYPRKETQCLLYR